jgi:hypothetical protein
MLPMIGPGLLWFVRLRICIEIVKPYLRLADEAPPAWPPPIENGLAGPPRPPPPPPGPPLPGPPLPPPSERAAFPRRAERECPADPQVQHDLARSASVVAGQQSLTRSMQSVRVGIGNRHGRAQRHLAFESQGGLHEVRRAHSRT